MCVLLSLTLKACAASIYAGNVTFILSKGYCSVLSDVKVCSTCVPSTIDYRLLERFHKAKYLLYLLESAIGYQPPSIFGRICRTMK